MKRFVNSGCMRHVAIFRFLIALVGAASVFAVLQAQGPAVGPCECPPVASRQVVYVTDNSGAGTGNATWTCDKIYVLTQPVFVNPGHTLTIEPGTVIQGRQGIITDTLSFTLPNGNPSQRKD